MASNWKDNCDYLGVLQLSGAAAEHVGSDEKVGLFMLAIDGRTTSHEGLPNYDLIESRQ